MNEETILCNYAGICKYCKKPVENALLFLGVNRSFVLALTCLADRLMYQSWVIVPFNFLKFNFLSSGGDYYGTHVFHWYFTQGFPSMVWTFLPFTVIGIVKSRERRLLGLIAWVLGLYSVLGHKEFR